MVRLHRAFASIRFALAVATALSIAAPAAAKRAPDGDRRAFGITAAEPTFARGDARIGAETGAARALYNVHYPVRAAEPEAMARQFLGENRTRLGLQDPGLGDLSRRATRRGLSHTVVRFEQRHQGLPVLAPDLAVSIDGSRRVTYVTSGYRPGIALASVDPVLAADDARAAALAWIGAEGALAHEAVRLAVLPEGKTARLVWQVTLVPAVRPTGDWEVLVDAESGEVVRSADRAHYVNGTGFTFDPDPLSAAHATYGATGYSDASDAASTQLNAARASRTLPDLTDLGGGVYKLQGPWAEIVDAESPFKGLFTQAGTTFNFDRAADGFEAVNAYFHIDQYMRYINVTLGMALMPYQYATGVRFDPSGLSGTDNSHYVTSTGLLAFGEGGVDDAEDADVVIHELGHGLHDWLTVGGLSQVNGLSEGFGDYVAQSYSRSLGQWASNETPYQWTFNWDGHNEFWAGRITNSTALYPGGLTGQIHTDGQIWATCLMRIWNEVGRNRTDAAVFEGISMTNSGSSQNDAAQAVLQAAIAMGYTNSEINSFVTHFQATGYTVSIGMDYVSSAITDACASDPSQQNGIIEPGEVVDIAVTVRSSALTHTNATGTLTSSTLGVTIVDGTASWPTLSPGVATASASPHFRVSLAPSVACLSTLDFQLSITSDQGGPYPMSFSKPVGATLTPSGLPLAIPDNNTTGVTSTLNVPSNVTLSDLNVRVEIQHTWVGDLYVKLRSPLGTEVVLLDRPGYTGSGFGCGNDNMNVTFDDAASIVAETHCAGTNPWLTGPAKPFGLLSAFNGQGTAGNWILTVSDRAASDTGNLVAWELLATPAIPSACDVCEAVVSVPLSRGGDDLALSANLPNPFARSTEIAFRLARAERASLRIYNVAGRAVATLVDGELPAGGHRASWDGRDDSGNRVAPGVYFYRLVTGTGARARSMLLVR